MYEITECTSVIVFCHFFSNKNTIIGIFYQPADKKVGPRL